MKVALITGPCPVGLCGVGDYTRMLATALERQGVHARAFESTGSALPLALRLKRAVADFAPDLVHLQYPTAGFGKGVVPHVFSMLHRVLLTIHELELTHWLRQVSCYPLAVLSQYIIFTCESNRKYALRWWPWLGQKSSVIPLGTNIPAAPNSGNRRVPADVIHFGLMRPNKGIEDVLEFARLAHLEGLPLRVRMVGSFPPQHAEYFSSVRKCAARLPVVWDLNLSCEAVSDRLARSTLGYFPFADGASERRTSLLAALANGVPVITTRGRFTPPELDGAVTYCESPEEAVQAARQIIDSPVVLKDLARRGRRYAARFTWESIARAHVEIYQRIVVNHENRH